MSCHSETALLRPKDDSSIKYDVLGLRRRDRVAVSALMTWLPVKLPPWPLLGGFKELLKAKTIKIEKQTKQGTVTLKKKPEVFMLALKACSSVFRYSPTDAHVRGRLFELFLLHPAVQQTCSCVLETLMHFCVDLDSCSL